MGLKKSPPILLWMVLSILLLGGIAIWDERRESAAALDEFAAEQTTLANAVAAALVKQPDVAPAAAAIEMPGSVVALFQQPGSRTLMTSKGDVVHSQTLEDGIEHGEKWVRIPREESTGLGLPTRLAIAGVATADTGKNGVWTTAVVATAYRVRDRENRAMWRLYLGFGLSSALIVLFGLLANRNQKKELVLARDLARTEANQASDEKLVRADKLATLGALATGIAHEVSTPLGVIVGRAEMLAPKVANDERAAKSVKVIAEQAERITGVVRAFLRLARGGTPTLERVQPAQLATAALELVEHRFEKAHISLSSNLPSDLPRVACDSKLFEQVLVNLLLNACDASSEGTTVNLAIEADADRVVFIVTDEGEGITSEIAKRATEPFFTTKSEAAGTGLGLAIANEIVKHHHGELTLAPREDKRGTSARVELAAVKAES